MTAQRVIVIGGGLAGCSAALALAKTGAEVILVEARRKLGGRAGSFPVPAAPSSENPAGRGSASVPLPTDLEIDYCQHVGMGCCTNLLQLIDWLGQNSDWKRYKSLHFYSPEGRYQKLRALPLLPAPIHLASWLINWPGLTWRDRTCVAKGMLKINRIGSIETLDNQTAQDWLTEAKQTSRAIEHFWGTIIVSALGETVDRASMAAVCKVMQDGFLRHRDAFHLLVPQRPLGQLFGTEMEVALKQHGVRLHLGTRVQSIDLPADTASQGVDVRTSQSHHQADALVLATSWNQTARILQARASSKGHFENAIASAKQTTASPISGIHTWWDKAWLPHDHVATVGRLSQWVFHHPALHLGESQDIYYQIVVSASRQLPKASEVELLRKMIIEDLSAIFPEVRKCKLLRLKVVTDPNAVFSFRPGSLAQRPIQRVTAGCILAGDWVNTGWPATMEGAILSGFRAADILLTSSRGSVQAAVFERKALSRPKGS